MDKRAINDIQNITQKTKHLAIRTPLNTSGEPKCPGTGSSSCFTCDTHPVKRHEIIWYENPVGHQCAQKIQMP